MPGINNPLPKGEEGWGVQVAAMCNTRGTPMRGEVMDVTHLYMFTHIHMCTWKVDMTT